MKTKLKNKLYGLLEKDSRLWDEEKKELNETLLKDLIDKLDAKLIELLLNDKETKEEFFIKVKDIYVLKQTELKFFIDENKVDNSYTQYQNKIGLRVGNKLLSERDEVVLDWPFKDCVLEGGMTKEDQKRNEIFFNEILAKDEIDRLYEPKALINWKRYTAKGEEKVKELKRDKDGTIRENLIIKGNNLLALHSLKEQFTGKVKLIYIDPPYNRENDSFGYNDNFKHSTWLTFMRNRLQVAYSFLSKQGLLFVHCDKNEAQYLKVLLDDIFTRENYIETITTVNNPRGRDYGGIANMHEFIHVYAKDKNDYVIYELERPNKVFDYTDKLGGFDIRELRNRNTRFNESNRPNLVYPFYVNPNSEDDDGFYEISLEQHKDWVEVYPSKSQGIQTVWRWGKDLSKSELNKNICARQMKDCRYQIVEKYRKSTRMARSVWWDKEVNSELGTKHLRQLFGKKVFDYPKPETLIKRIVEMATIDDDLILDFCLGSGTTASTCLKLKRKFIGVEQMDYLETVAVQRLVKVVNGEQGGISKTTNWQGGGNFIYVELAKWNEEAKEKILKAKSLSELEKLFDELYERYFLNYNVKTKEFNGKTIKEEGFLKLSLDEQKKLFVEMLDMNQMYVNFSERADKKYNLSQEDIKLSEQFYLNK